MLMPRTKPAFRRRHDAIPQPKIAAKPLVGHGIPTIDLVLLTLSLTLLVAVFTLGIRI